MSGKLPVTVITGFLGSGKTTLIRHLLQNNQGKRIAVLVNEFGELGIDGELLRSCGYCPEDEAESNIVELTNGCLCCTVQEEFLPTMQQLLKRRDSIDSILIETSGLALPKPLVKAFRWQEIRHAATVDSVIAVVDCEAVANGRFASNVEAVNQQRLADPNLEHETPLQELFEDQLACADLVVLTKQDLVTSQQEAEVRKLVKQELPREVKMVVANNTLSTITPELLLGLGAAVEDNLGDRPSHHDTEDDHDHDEEINSTHLILDRAFQPEIIQKELAALVESQEIYRIKGFVAVPHKAMRLVIQGVGKRFDQFYDRPWKPDESQQTRLVFIGKKLDTATIADRLTSISQNLKPQP